MPDFDTLCITVDDLRAFHLQHFPDVPCPTALLDHSAEPVQGEDSTTCGEYDLGYYPDGVKRTITGEEIAIFRHSEFQELLKVYRDNETPEPPSPTPGDPSAAMTGDPGRGQGQIGEANGREPLKQRNRGSPMVNQNPSASSEASTGQDQPTGTTDARHNPKDFIPEGKAHTFRRQARELDEQKSESVELDYG
ncbi:hypothetical protein EJ06DRAFT_527327 [Trichodelitschia bisporula]|uniref:Uncharacterized protein n=1 Tax=Trichodelitschia bisporula TaxID=703511 RepID=A0A6G1I6A9_9PEZI|nr:hypothetical protein EJ06DRAFT_527327 [Trichodelitschia bisporula]